MPDFVILLGVVVGFVGVLSAVLWSIAAATRGEDAERVESRR